MRAGIALVAFGALEWFAACSDSHGPCSTTCPPPAGLNVSNAVPSAVIALDRVEPSRSGTAGPNVTYVSLEPGTVPGGRQAAVRRVGAANSLSTVVTNGGFDPVPVESQVGDSIDVVVVDASGSTIYHTGAAVPAARPPVVVRTEPPPRKRDVPLNASVVIVFSEPIDSTTLTTSTVELRRGTAIVPGSVRFIDPSDIVATFQPAASLDSSTGYQLVVTTGIHDRDGQPLDSETVVSFTTGTSQLSAVASVNIFAAPDCLFVRVGWTAQLVAVPHDSNNAVIAGLPAIWSTTNPSVATVSATGLFKAVGPGGAFVKAVVGGVTGSKGATVSP